MKISALILSTLFGLCAGSAMAAAPAAATGTGPAGAHATYCQSHQQECTQLSQKFDQWCSANADKCTGLKAHFEKHREFCEQNQDKCQQHRAAMRARMQKVCQAHPDAPRCQGKPGQSGDEDDEGGDDDGPTSR